MSVNAAVVQYVQRRRRFKLFGVLLLLLMVVAVAAVIVVIVRRRTDTTKRVAVDEINLSEAKSKLMKDAEELGLTPEELEDALQQELENEKKKCNVSPLPNGLCGSGFYLEKDCCYPLSSTRNKTHERLERAGGIIKDVGISIAAGVIVETALYRGLTTRAYREGLKATRTAAWQGVKTAATGGAKSAATASATGAKTARAALAAARAARAVSAAGKVAAAVGRYAMAAAGGPVGLMIAAALLAFDAISLTLDILDVDGYDSFTSQGLLTNMRNIIDYSVAAEFEKNDIEYPMIFPISTLFPEEMELAQEYMSSQIIGKYLIPEMAKNAKVQSAFDKYVQDTIDNPNVEPPVPKEFTDFVSELLNIKHLERDKLLYSKLQELLGDQAYKIEFYESISSRDRMGISLSREAAKEWNSANEKTWMESHDLYNPPEIDDTKTPPKQAACYTDTYYVYQSGPADKPNMIAKKLPEKTVIANYYGPLLAYCEKVRKMKSTSTGVDPKALGTRFNFDTGVCEFSKEMCDRYGLEFKDNDCKPRPGQDVAELIFGTTITRAYIKEYDQRLDDFKSGDPGKIMVALLKTQLDLLTFGAGSVIIAEGMKSYAKKSKPATVGDCPSGMRDDKVNCWLDPYKIPTGTVPNTCRASEPTRIGMRCYEDCPDGYERNEAVPTLCEPKCGGDYPMKRGLICYEDCRKKGGEWFNGSLVECAACNNGWRSDGFLGCKKSGGWKPAWPYRSSRKQKSILEFGKTKERKSHSLKCPEGKVKRDGLCYEPCKNKGPEGQYKYKGVLDWCQPEGGAGIKKGLDDRMKCPDGWERKGPLCYEPCKEGERDDGLFCKRME
jgi:hypothetical protein